MKNYLELADLSARHNKNRSRMTVLCIILAVFLVTSVFSMVDFEYIHMKEKLIRDHGNWHIMLSGVSGEEAGSVREQAPVEAFCRYDAFNYDLDEDIYLDRRPLCVIGTDKSFFDDMTVGTLEEGRFPESGSEALLSLNAKNVSGYGIGDTAVIKAPRGEYSFKVCGFVADTPDSLAADAVICVLDYSAFEALAGAEGQKREPQYYIRFREGMKLRSVIENLKESRGWTDENVSENTALLGITGMSSSNYVVGLYGIAAALVLLVALAGIFMISGSMNANIAQRTQFFGMLRCVGAGKRQVRHIVRREALNWLKTALPVGAAASVFACWGVCAVLAYGIGGEWEQMPVGRISVTGIVLGALVGLVTVLLSAGAPARRAAKVSPIAAVSGSGTAAFSGGSLRNAAGKVDISLGIRHALTGKKSLLLMTGSFALSIILFLSFSVMLDWVDSALTSNKPYTPDLCVYRDGYEEQLESGLAGRLRGIEGVKYAYGRKHVLADVDSDKGINGIDLISYDDIQFKWAEKDLLRGSIDETRDGTGSVTVVFGKNNTLDVGDTIELGGRFLRVTALLSDSPLDEGEYPTVICSEKTFEDYIGAAEYKVIDIQLEKNAGEDTVARIRTLLDDGTRLSDRRAVKTEVNSTYLAFSVLVYLFLGLVALIAVCNIINSISMSVTARRREYGMMRAVGLDKRQLVRMMTAEALTYALCGYLAGCAAGLPLNAWFYKKIISDYWGTPWKLPAALLLMILALVLCSAVAAVYAPARSLSESPVTETMA